MKSSGSKYIDLPFRKWRRDVWSNNDFLHRFNVYRLNCNAFLLWFFLLNRLQIVSKCVYFATYGHLFSIIKPSADFEDKLLWQSFITHFTNGSSFIPFGSYRVHSTQTYKHHHYNSFLALCASKMKGRNWTMK